jgi:uncharacterized protein YxjI
MLFAWTLPARPAVVRMVGRWDHCVPRYLNVADKLLSLGGRMSITDEAGQPLYDAGREFAWISPAWRIVQRGLEVARIRRVILAWPAAWEVKCEFGSFRIERDLYSGTGGYWVNGGPFDKAEVRGRLLSDNLSISHGERTLASARAALLSLRGGYSVELADDDKLLELLTAIVMVTHHMDENPGLLLGLVFG